MNKTEKLIETLKNRKDRVFRVLQEKIYSIPQERADFYNDFLKFAKDHPERAFKKYYLILSEFKEIEEL